ncbi:hypothetical protein EVAR_75586_1 [Eumeta japonica]|uniref:Uncharacterized protein n=1 Tax=Eumeta variegata TaxID=151549 RepID=A0A4C1U0M9_EUMVA|nr:hypothetical protein EVAR_75586_1 [Eumeta japonica]
MTRHETRLPTLMKRTDGSTDPISCAKAKTNGRRKLLKANSRRGGDHVRRRNIISRRCDRNYEKSPTNVNGAELTEVCRKCRLRRVICLPNAYVITNPFTCTGSIISGLWCDDRPQTRRRDTGAIHMPDNTRRTLNWRSLCHQTP